jgi:hypothetical protein
MSDFSVEVMPRRRRTLPATGAPATPPPPRGPRRMSRRRRRAMNDLDDFITNLPRQIAAERALHNGDVRPRLELWSTSEPVSLLGAWGPCKVGFEQVTRTFEWVASRFRTAPRTSSNYLPRTLSAIWLTPSATSPVPPQSTEVPSSRTSFACRTFTAARTVSGNSFTAMATIRRGTKAPKHRRAEPIRVACASEVG